jgi:DNA-binding XRE family transcriptional regulator
MKNEHLIAKRKSCNLSQEQVAKAIGISARNYQYIEAGERKPNVETAISIAELLKCSVPDLFGTSRRQPGDCDTHPDYSNSALAGVGEMKELDRSLRDFDHRDIGVVVDILRDGRLDDPTSREAALKARDALNVVLGAALG